MLTVDLGPWRPYVNVEEMLSWYQLPRDVAAECQAYRSTGTELNPLSRQEYRQAHAHLVQYVRQSVAPYSPAYHNDELHFAATEADGLLAADAHAANNPAHMPETVRDVFGLSLRSHDSHHCASTFRVHALRGVYRPQLGTRVSSEWVTAQANDALFTSFGYPLPARLFQFYVAWSSTYGGNTPVGRQLGIPSPQPTTPWGTIMRAADVCPPGSYDVWLQQTIAANYGEIPALPPARSWQEWKARGQAFTDYILHCMRQVDIACQDNRLTDRIGWRKRLKRQREWVEQLDSPRSEVHQRAKQLLSTYGVSLTA